MYLYVKYLCGIYRYMRIYVRQIDVYLIKRFDISSIVL